MTAHDTIPRPIRPIGDVVSIYDVDAQCSEREEAFTSQALGLLETFGIAYCIHAADAMCKAADVELVGFENMRPVISRRSSRAMSAPARRQLPV